VVKMQIATGSKQRPCERPRLDAYRCRRFANVLRLPTLAFLALTAILTSPMNAAATTDPYPSGQTGYDVSYPQCGGVTPAGSFGIIGVNGGRPFSNNGCLGAEYNSAPTTSGTASLYINTGYSGAYGRNVTSTCSTLSKSVRGSSAQKKAWGIGCSEADTSISYAAQQRATSVAVWWLDVETGNSWSSSDLSLNRYAIQGATTRLGQAGLVGVYSTASMWTRITGGTFSPTGIAADWDVSASGGSCTAPFTSSVDPVWLVQSTTSGFDSDLACP
jgi:hypothetical protein